MIQAALSLALQSITQPRQVARWLIDLRLSREALVTGFALVVVINSLLFGVSVLLDPAPLPWFLARPAVYGGLQALSLIATLLGLYFGGRVLGGQASVQDITVLVIWMQILRALRQVLLLVLLPISAVLGGFLLSLTSVIGIWIMVSFVDEAHGFSNLLKSLGAIIIGLFGMAVVLSILLILLGIDPSGITANV